MTKYLVAIRTIVGRSVRKYAKDDPIKLAGTTAYFVVFAIAPILIIITSALGLVIDEQTVTTKLYDEIKSLIGQEGASFLRAVVANFQQTDRNVLGTIIGVGVFLFASTTFFTVLQKNLNFVWRVRSAPARGWLKVMKDRLLSFGLILSLGFILLVSLVVDATLAFLRDVLDRYIDDLTLYFVEPANFIVSFGVVTLMFVLVFKFLPDAQITWNVTWVGALITATLFKIGKYVIGAILGLANINAMFGAAGSVVVLLLWVFYTSLILYFGAEITEQYARYFKHDIKPQEHAVRIEITELGSGG